MNNKFGLKIAILSLSFLLMTRLTISPALAEIGKAFPAVSQASLMNMVVLASAVAIPFGLLSGFLSRFMKKKTLVLIGLGLYLIGGLGPMLASSYTMILALRAVLGAGIGFLLPMCTGLIADFFEGKERLGMFGFQNSSVATGNIITSLLAGVFAAISWKYSFLIYLVGVISLVLVIVKIPEPERVQAPKGKRKPVNGKVSFVCCAMLIYAIIYFSFFGYLSFVIEDNKFGDAATAGVATMLMTAASLAMGFAFKTLVGTLKKYCVVVALLINFVGFFLLSMATSIVMIFAGAIIIGFGFGFLMPTSVMLVTEASDKSETTFTNGLLMTALNIGTAVSPTLLSGVGKAFNNQDGKFIYLVCSIALIAAAAFALVKAIRGVGAQEQTKIAG